MIYFVSGHRDIKEEEFQKYYIPKLQSVIEKDPEAEFVVGDYEGVDYMAQLWLSGNGMGPKTTVYHMFSKPRHHVEGLKTIGGFKTDLSRDGAMTKASDFDIAFYHVFKGNSGTLQNIKRRGKMLG